MCPDAFLPTPPQGGFPGINLVCARYNCNPSLLPYLVAALGASASWLGPGELLGRLAYLPLPSEKSEIFPPQDLAFPLLALGFAWEPGRRAAGMCLY